jgi:hypothetical protein
MAYNATVPDADRRNIMRTFLALTGAVATATVWNAGKSRAEATPNEGKLVALGQRIEQLTRERETAEHRRDEARACFEKIAPKGTPRIGISDTSIAKFWDGLIECRIERGIMLMTEFGQRPAIADRAAGRELADSISLRGRRR